MNIDKPCNNSSCEPTATGRRSKKTHGLHRCTRSLWPRIFLTFLLMQMDPKRICKRYRLRLVLEHEICRRPTDQREVISRIPRIYTMSRPTRFVRFVRLVFEKKYIRVWIILCWPLISRIPRIYTMSQPKKIRPIRAISVRKKYIRVWVILTWPLISRIKRII